LVHSRRVLSNLPLPLTRLLECLKSGTSPVPAVAPDPGERVRLVRPNTILTPAQIDDLVAHYLAGGTVDGLARDFKVYRATARDHLVRRGVPLRHVKVELSSERLGEAAALYEGGATLRQLGVQFAVSPNTMRSRLAKMGVTIRVSPVGAVSETLGSGCTASGRDLCRP
jgi:hypothetical protein